MHKYKSYLQSLIQSSRNSSQFAYGDTNAGMSSGSDGKYFLLI